MIPQLGYGTLQVWIRVKKLVSLGPAVSERDVREVRSAAIGQDCTKVRPTCNAIYEIPSLTLVPILSGIRLSRSSATSPLCSRVVTVQFADSLSLKI